MKKRTIVPILLSLLLVMSLGCRLSLADVPFLNPFGGSTSSVETIASLTLTPNPSTSPVDSSTTPSLPVAITPTWTSTNSAIIPGSPTGPYAVILVAANDVLNIRSAPGSSNPVVGSFSATETNVMRTGPSAYSGMDLWVEVNNPAGGTGWVNDFYLTEYIPSVVFCADADVNSLLTNLRNALKDSDGIALAALVSPKHGMAVRRWRGSNPFVFDRVHAEWLFESTYVNDWGSSPGSGLTAEGSFRDIILPVLLDVTNSPHQLICNDASSLTSFSINPWPEETANMRYYNIFKPATEDVQLNWRNCLVGVEYVDGKPFIFSLILFEWEP